MKLPLSCFCNDFSIAYFYFGTTCFTATLEVKIPAKVLCIQHIVSSSSWSSGVVTAALSYQYKVEKPERDDQ